MMTSCLTRGLHKILACRLAESVEVDNMQRGFKAEDGVAANLSFIKNMIQTAKTTSTPLYIGFIVFQESVRLCPTRRNLGSRRSCWLGQQQHPLPKDSLQELKNRSAGPGDNNIKRSGSGGPTISYIV